MTRTSLSGLLRGALSSRFPRAAMAVAGIAGSTLLVLVLLAAHGSLRKTVVVYLGGAGGDVWVAPPGTDNLIRSGGFLPGSLEGTIRSLPQVAAVDPILRTFVTVEADRDGARRRLTVLAIGYRTARGMGGPPAVSSGRRARGGPEILLDRAAAFRLGVGLDDRVLVNGRTVRVVGLTRGTNLLATQFLFVDFTTAQRALGVPDGASFFIVRLLTPPDPRGFLLRGREALPDAALFSRAEFVENNLREVTSGFLPLVALLTAVGLAVGAALVGLLAQGLAEDRRADVAVLFALGASPAALSRGFLAHVERLVLCGGALGTSAAYGLRAILDRLIPTVELNYRAADVLVVFLLFAFSSALAALLPVMRLRNTDPLDAFRS